MVKLLHCGDNLLKPTFPRISALTKSAKYRLSQNSRCTYLCSHLPNFSRTALKHLCLDAPKYPHALSSDMSYNPAMTEMAECSDGL